MISTKNSVALWKTILIFILFLDVEIVGFVDSVSGSENANDVSCFNHLFFKSNYMFLLQLLSASLPSVFLC